MDRGDEGAHVGVAFDAAEGSLGFEHPGGDPSFLHRAVTPVLDPAGGVLMIEIIDSTQFVFVTCAAAGRGHRGGPR